jgi:hypothetical protein
VTTAVPFLFVFIAGVGAGVYSMFQGVTPGPSARGTTRFGLISAPSVAAFAIVFGAVGYLCATRTLLSHPAILAIASGSGAATIPLSAPLTAKLARWRKAIFSGEAEIEGQLATVSRPITRTAPGEVVFERDGEKIRNRAVHILDEDLAIGEDVVIDRIENGTAYVEDWHAVERRL